MKKITQILSLSFVFLIAFSSNAQMIKTKVPTRAIGQTDVLRMAAPAIPIVRIAFIGLGMRGSDAVERMTHIKGVEIVALCDMLQERTKESNAVLVKLGFPEAKEFYGENSWKQVTKLPNVDLVYVATDWLHHAPIGIQAMKDGKHVAIEVPSAMTLKEIWELIDTSEKTRKHCMQLENCVYDFFELTTLNMIQQGVFGEIKHVEGSYIHGLQPYWGKYWNNWRMDYNRKHRGDLYPTHGMGPACLALNIHRGDKMNYLVSMDTKPIGNPAYIKEKTGEIVADFRDGDHTMTMIRTELGKTIQIQHDVTSPRPYSRMYQISGTKGFANKYPIEGYALDEEQVGRDIVPGHKKLAAHSYMPDEVKEALMIKYKNPIVKDIEEEAKEVGGHGGMDFIMDYRLIYCLQNGFPLDMDVYDLAEWTCLGPLTELSLDNNSTPVEIPDFTRGGWNKLKTVEFSK